MRLKLSVAVVGFLLAGGVCAHAQAPQTSYYSNATNPAYGGQQPAPVPFYNNGANAQPFSMEQMIAGKNAPSYNYGNNGAQQPYGFNNGANMDMSGSLSPAQVEMLRAQRNAAAQNFEAQYLANMQQQMGANGASQYQGNAFSQLYNKATEDDEPAPKKRRVVYKEKNNPLITPPRLFDPDQ